CQRQMQATWSNARKLVLVFSCRVPMARKRLSSWKQTSICQTCCFDKNKKLASSSGAAEGGRDGAAEPRTLVSAKGCRSSSGSGRGIRRNVGSEHGRQRRSSRRRLKIRRAKFCRRGWSCRPCAGGDS